MKKTVPFLILCLIFSISHAQNCSVSIIKFQSSGPCEGKSIQLMASPITPGNIYTWSCPNSIYNTTSGPFIYIPYSSLADSGVYTLSVLDSTGCVASNSINVTIIPKPVVYISGQGFDCLGTQTPLFANDFSGPYGPYQYLWDNGLTTQSISVLHNGGIAPHPSCTITNGSGCAATNQTSFLIGSLIPPIAAINYSGLTSFCAASALTLNATPDNPQIIYSWRKNGKAISNATASTYQAKSTGWYKVIVTDMNGCKDTSNGVSVTVFPMPSTQVLVNGSLSFCNGDSVMLSGIGGAGYTYQWRKNGVPISGANQEGYTAKSAGNYRVEITTDHDCYQLSKKAVVMINCKEDALSDETNQMHWIVSPNPSHDGFRLACRELNNETIKMAIFDVFGRNVVQTNQFIYTGEIRIGTDLPRGIYMARMESSKGVNITRLIKN